LYLIYENISSPQIQGCNLVAAHPLRNWEAIRAVYRLYFCS